MMLSYLGVTCRLICTSVNSAPPSLLHTPPFSFLLLPILSTPFPFPIISPSPCQPPLHLYMRLFQISGVSLDGLFDAEQHRGQPLVQAGHRVKLLHSLRERLAVLLLVGLKEFL